uniref:Putative transmembrane protein n=1 Tax=Rhodococcus sp. PY11 TaxID=551544 RepID=B5MA94_9NOCA|nr:putative transmembrane protein [Rhodococcus sp. PY11]
MSAQRARRMLSAPSRFVRYVGRPAGLAARVLVVLMLTAVTLIGIGTGTAAASGFDCKDVPTPEFPNETVETTFDSSSANRPPIEGGGGTGYESYGWAGLKWHTYDLGCGEDLVRAPGAVNDTTLGNTFLTIGKSLAAAAFWLDDQTKTGRDALDAGVDSALEQFDRIVYSISDGMRGVYGQWLGIALTVVAVIVLWKSLKADTAGVTRTSAIAAAGLMLGALMVGAPQKAVQVADDTFGSLITDTQDQIFSVQFGDGPGGGTLVGGPTDPRNVLIDQVFLPDWRTGWFDTNYDDADAAGLGPKLRDSLAFSYEEQERVKNDPGAQAELAEQKADKFREIVSSLESDHQLSYYQFQGKDSGRTSTGFVGMVKLAMPSLLWIGASILKITALLAIRFAILFAPLWVPFAMIASGWLARILRMLATAYLWGVAGAVIVALYLMALVQLYVNADGQVDGSWRLWFMVLLTVVCWAIMRPFKRVGQTFTRNSSSMVNRKTREAKRSLKRKAFAAAGAALGGPGGTIAAKTGEHLTRRNRRDDEAETKSTDLRPEGRGLNNRRQQALAQARAEALTNRTEHRAHGVDRGADRDARIAGIAASAGLNLDRGKQSLGDNDTERAVTSGTAAWKRLDKDEAENRRRERQARTELLTASVGQRWDGGDRSAIAPMKVYTPARARESAHATSTGTSSRESRHGLLRGERSTGNTPSRPRVWNAPTPNSPTSRDRYL